MKIKDFKGPLMNLKGPYDKASLCHLTHFGGMGLCFTQGGCVHVCVCTLGCALVTEVWICLVSLNSSATKYSESVHMLTPTTTPAAETYHL